MGRSWGGGGVGAAGPLGPAREESGAGIAGGGAIVGHIFSLIIMKLTQYM